MTQPTLLWANKVVPSYLGHPDEQLVEGVNASGTDFRVYAYRDHTILLHQDLPTNRYVVTVIPKVETVSVPVILNRYVTTHPDARYIGVNFQTPAAALAEAAGFILAVETQ